MTLKAFDEALESLVEQGKITLHEGQIFNEKAGKILGDMVSRSERARKGGIAKARKNSEQNQSDNPAPAEQQQEPSSAEALLETQPTSAIPDTRSQIPDKKASKLAQKGDAEENAADPDRTLEADLRHAAGWHHDAPRLSHVKPIADLIAQGLSLHDDVIPTIRQLAPAAEQRTSWNYFIGPLTDTLNRRKAQEGGAQSPEPKASKSATAPASAWVWQGTPQWEAWVAAHPGRKWPTKEARHPEGGFRPGWYFPSEWPAARQGQGQGAQGDAGQGGGSPPPPQPAPAGSATDPPGAAAA